MDQEDIDFWPLRLITLAECKRCTFYTDCSRLKHFNTTSEDMCAPGIDADLTAEKRKEMINTYQELKDNGKI